MRTVKKRLKELEKAIGKDDKETTIELVASIINMDKTSCEKKIAEFKIRHG